MSNGGEQRPRARQACEPCRRKKSKCPGERPVCSFCSRLNQSCTYAKPSDDYRIQKGNSADKSLVQHRQKDRVDVLESRVDKMEELMGLFSTGQPSASLADRDMSFAPFTGSSPSRAHPGQGDSNQEQDTFHPIHRHTPPSYVLMTLVDVYAAHFSTSAFLIFDIEKLQLNISKFSRVLLWSFLSLVVRFSSHAFFLGVEDEAVAFYATSARRMLLSEMATPSRSLELLQSFCCLCYSEIVAGKAASALLTLGLAARYAFCTNLLNTNNPKSHSSKHDEVARSLWALYYLDRTYGSSLNTIHVMPIQNSLPEISASVCKPKGPASSEQRLDEDEDEPLMKVQDDGIITYVFKVLSIWGDLTTRLKRMRTDSQEKGWESTSAYQQTRAQVFELERTYPQKHRFDWLRSEDRTAEEMAANRQYWDPWILSQMLIHGVQALLNHPVLHFFRRTDQSVRPPSFQQQIVDHSILHSRWIVRLIELYQDKHFQISDPFIGHMVASTATVLFFLSFSKDEQLAMKAVENFDKCKQFVGDLGQKWPHLLHTKAKLAKLAAVLPRSVPRHETSRRPKVNEALVWSLLDYAASSSPEDQSRDVHEVVEVDVNTQHLSPLDHTTPRNAQITSPMAAEVMITGNAPPEWTQNEFSLDMLEIPDLPGFLLSDEYWTGGQL